MGAEFWLPALISAGATAGSNALFGGVEDPKTLASFARQPGDFLDPRLQLEQNMRDRAQLQAIMAGRAAAPLDIPGAFVQPLGVRAGGGMAGPIGVTAQDPALFNPQQFLYRPGAQFAQPDFHDPAFQSWKGEYKPGMPPLRYGANELDIGGTRSGAPLSSQRWFGGEYAPRYTSYDPGLPLTPPYASGPVKDERDIADRFRGLDQPGVVGTPTVGGGIPQLMANLELLGVREDGTGTLRMDDDAVGAVANPDLFQGSVPMNPRGGVPASEVAGAPTFAPAPAPLLAQYSPKKPRRPRRPPNRTPQEDSGVGLDNSDLNGEYLNQ